MRRALVAAIGYPGCLHDVYRRNRELVYCMRDIRGTHIEVIYNLPRLTIVLLQLTTLLLAHTGPVAQRPQMRAARCSFCRASLLQAR